MFVSNRKKKARAWNKAVEFLSSTDSRIRVETQTIAGEEYEVWRWIGVLTPKMKAEGTANHLVSGESVSIQGPINTATFTLRILFKRHSENNLCMLTGKCG